jgi:hypothetical protein
MAFKHKKKRGRHKIKRDRYGIPDLAGDVVRLETLGVALNVVGRGISR